MKPKNVLVLLLVALLCVGAFFLVDGLGGGSDGNTLPPVWPEFNRSDATHIAISTKARRLDLKKREGALDRWDVVEGTELVRADANAVDDLLSALSRQKVIDRIEFGSKDAGPPKEYGLDEPIVEVIVAADKEHRIAYGKLSREGNNVYVDGGPGTDVWLVPKDASDLAISALSSGMRSTRLFDQTAFDVATLELVKGGVTVAEFHRDTQQLWTMSQPWKGYPNPKDFDTLLSDVVNAEVDVWTEFGAPDLAKYGLSPPQMEVRITPRGEGKKAEALLVGARDATGVFAMEAGTKTVVHVGGRFANAVFMDPLQYRDRSFTRLGHGAAAVEVRVGTVAYKLEKAGTWEVVIGQDRKPADSAKVELLLDRLATWQTIEFLDSQKPEDLGISERDFIEITRQSVGKEPGAKIVLFFNPDGAKRPDAKSVYARRKDDGAAEKVESEPLDELLRGPEQYFRKWIADLPADSIDEIARDPGSGDEGKNVQLFKIRRNLKGPDSSWKWEMDGNLGKPAGGGISEILAALSPERLKALEWLPFEAAKDNEIMGFRSGAHAHTLSITVHRANYIGLDPDPKIEVGKRREGGGYYARLVGAEGARGWVFILADDVVKGLSANVEVVETPKDPPK